MKTVLSIGNFDGLHLGHRKLLEQLKAASIQTGLPSTVITYTDHPAFVLNKRPRPLLLTPSGRKAKLLNELGVDEVRCLPFTEEFSRISADGFLKDFLIPQFHPHTIVVGYDSHFGHGRQGTLEFLRSHSEIYGYRCLYVPPMLAAGEAISSSRIRTLLMSSRVEEANALLGTPYRLYGVVTGGLGLGRGLGFPTANLSLEDPHQLVPGSGVYLSMVHLGERRFFGLTNIGTSPTLKHTNETVVETYMLDHNEDIYGASMELELLEYLRPEETFRDADELVRAMHLDLARARELLRRYQP